MRARELTLWKVACGALTVAVFAADALVFWWLEAWDYPASDHKREMLFQVLAAGGFAFPLGTYMLSWGIFDLKRARASMRWPVVQGRVLTRSVEEKRTFTRRGTQISYVPKLSYEYEVSGQHYQSDVIQFGLKDVSTREEAEQILGSNVAGKPVQVHYDPEDPQLAVLQSASHWALRAIIGAVFAFAVPFIVALFARFG